MLRERNRELVEEGDKAVAQWREVVGRLRGRPSQKEFARMRADLRAARGKLLVQIRETAEARHELGRLKRAAGCPRAPASTLTALPLWSPPCTRASAAAHIRPTHARATPISAPLARSAVCARRGCPV